MRSMRAAIYTRVSKDRDLKAASVSSQEKSCRDLCEQQGWEVASVFTDNDRSASRFAKKDRPAWEQLLSSLTDFDVLVTWEASRAARDMEVYVILRAACREAGVLWSYSGKLYDFNRTDDAFSTGLDMLLAERESSQTRDRINRVVRQNAESGKPHGRVPFGYSREYDPKTKAFLRQIPHPEESKVITEGADRVLKGESCYAVAKDFQERGMPLVGGKRWAPHRLTRLLKNPTYAGKRVYQGKIVGDAVWAPLIPFEKWEALQGLLLAPERMKHHGTEPAWLLTGIARCGVCGASVTRGSNRSSHTYVCREAHCVARVMHAVDALVVATLKARLTSKDALEAIHAGADPEVADTATRITEMESRLESFYQQAADGSLSAQGLARVESGLLNKLDAERAKLRAMSRPKQLVIDDPQGLAEKWDTLPLLQQREVIRSLLKITILPARPGVRVFDPSTVRLEPR